MLCHQHHLPEVAWLLAELVVMHASGWAALELDWLLLDGFFWCPPAEWAGLSSTVAETLLLLSCSGMVNSLPAIWASCSSQSRS